MFKLRNGVENAVVLALNIQSVNEAHLSRVCATKAGPDPEIS
jgi:hypothetical protein